MTPLDNSSPDPNESQDPLWDLLGKARDVEVSPLFSRNVMRALRQEQYQQAQAREAAPEQSLSFLDFCRQLFRWRLAALVSAAAAITLIASHALLHEQEWSNGAVAAFSQSNSSDFEIIKNLDELLANEENSELTSLWLNASIQ